MTAAEQDVIAAGAIPEAGLPLDECGLRESANRFSHRLFDRADGVWEAGRSSGHAARIERHGASVFDRVHLYVAGARIL